MGLLVRPPAFRSGGEPGCPCHLLRPSQPSCYHLLFLFALFSLKQLVFIVISIYLGTMIFYTHYHPLLTINVYCTQYSLFSSFSSHIPFFLPLHHLVFSTSSSTTSSAAEIPTNEAFVAIFLFLILRLHILSQSFLFLVIITVQLHVIGCFF